MENRIAVSWSSATTDHTLVYGVKEIRNLKINIVEFKLENYIIEHWFLLKRYYPFRCVYTRWNEKKKYE